MRNLSRSDGSKPFLDIEADCGPEWAAWYRLTPAERWTESEHLWTTFIALGGSLDPEPDTHSPFYDAAAPGAVPLDRWPGMRVVRRSGV